MKRLRLLTLALVALAAVAALAPPARAQVDEPVRPPKVEQPAQAPKWMYYLVGVGAIAVCVGLAVFPGRRTHED
jgi:hypothetical protein